MEKLFFFDLETTGTDPAKNGIHQISGCMIIDGEIKTRFNLHCRNFPDQIVNLDALAISDITLGRLESYDDPKVAHRQLIELLSQYCDKYDRRDKFHLAGYNNANFDNAFLREFFRRCGDDYFGSWFWPDPIDVYVLASFCLMPRRHQMLNFRLHSVAAEFGIVVNPDKLHDAAYDIDLTYQVYLKCKSKLTREAT